MRPFRVVLIWREAKASHYGGGDKPRHYNYAPKVGACPRFPHVILSEAKDLTHRDSSVVSLPQNDNERACRTMTREGKEAGINPATTIMGVGLGLVPDHYSDIIIHNGEGSDTL